MRTLCLLVVVAALAGRSDAAVRFFFTSSSDPAGLKDTKHAFDDTDGSGIDYTSYALKDAFPTVGVPTIDPTAGEFLYLWVVFEGEKNGRVIQGVNMVANDQAFNGGIAETDRGMYIGADDNGDTGGPLRWNYSSKTSDVMTLAGVNVPGIKNQSSDGWLYFGGDHRVALLGAIQPGAGAYELHLGLGKNGVSYAKNSDNQRAPIVRFGANDEEFDANVRDDPDYYWSSDADAVIIPEPAAALLIALAALSLRRR